MNSERTQTLTNKFRCKIKNLVKIVQFEANKGLTFLTEIDLMTTFHIIA